MHCAEYFTTFAKHLNTNININTVSDIMVSVLRYDPLADLLSYFLTYLFVCKFACTIYSNSIKGLRKWVHCACVSVFGTLIVIIKFMIGFDGIFRIGLYSLIEYKAY